MKEEEREGERGREREGERERERERERELHTTWGRRRSPERRSDGRYLGAPTHALSPDPTRCARWPARGSQNPGEPEGGPGALPRRARPGGLVNQASGKMVNQALPNPSDHGSRKRLGQPGLPANAWGESTRGSRPLLPISSPLGRGRFGGPRPPGRFRPLDRAHATTRRAQLALDPAALTALWAASLTLSG